MAGEPEGGYAKTLAGHLLIAAEEVLRNHSDTVLANMFSDVLGMPFPYTRQDLYEAARRLGYKPVELFPTIQFHDVILSNWQKAKVENEGGKKWHVTTPRWELTFHGTISSEEAKRTAQVIVAALVKAGGVKDVQ